MKKRWLVFIALVVIVLCLFTSPTIALRTHLFLLGHPIIAFETEFKKIDSWNDIGDNAQLYELTIPPFETGTQSHLETFLVKQYGIFYIPKFYVDV
ncbi:hypothetical protein AAGS61_09110 [Lysinibacillus sp. KU-BSD001]|uniref:hypothetical protein n=1 Tax=Lysinibacillus sp. KU-BSD001 TaxID=3141328 RepID=UPI0036ED3AE2